MKSRAKDMYASAKTAFCIADACEADEETLLDIVNDAINNWRSGDFESQYDCIVKALDDALENGDIKEYDM